MPSAPDTWTFRLRMQPCCGMTTVASRTCARGSVGGRRAAWATRHARGARAPAGCPRGCRTPRGPGPGLRAAASGTPAAAAPRLPARARPAGARVWARGQARARAGARLLQADERVAGAAALQQPGQQRGGRHLLNRHPQLGRHGHGPEGVLAQHLEVGQHERLRAEHLRRARGPQARLSPGRRAQAGAAGDPPRRCAPGRPYWGPCR